MPPEHARARFNELVEWKFYAWNHGVSHSGFDVVGSTSGDCCKWRGCWIHQNHRKLDNWGSSFHWLDGACTFVGIASSTKIIQIHQISKTKQWTVQKLMYYLFPWDITAALSATSGHCWLTQEVQPPGPISAICHPESCAVQTNPNPPPTSPPYNEV